MRCPLAAACAIAVTTGALAGPLTPPAGAPAPTNKTLQEVEPRTPIGGPDTVTISQPGSYYLTQNINASAGSPAVIITADAVELDLNGYAIEGGSSAGVRVSAPFQDNAVAIRNGTIRGFLGDGVESTTSALVVIDDVQFQQCRNGVNLTGPGVVTNCTARFCDQTGFRTSALTTISGCLAQNNADGYIIAHGTIQECVADSNILQGFIVNQPSEISRCVSRLNGRSGFVVNVRGQVTQCVANQNGEDGFFLGAKCRITNCHAADNTTSGVFAGIRADVKCTIDSCTVANNRFGIIAGINSLVVRNTATDNIVANYDMTGSNFGPIVTPSGAITSTNPWANFEY
ncbi:MAG: hypothetical protein AAGK04_07875 [Planctomycetota bacterium]